MRVLLLYKAAELVLYTMNQNHCNNILRETSDSPQRPLKSSKGPWIDYHLKFYAENTLC